MKKIAIGIIFLCCGLQAVSQNTGYMGRRFMVNAEVVLSPSYFNPNFRGAEGYTAFNYLFSPNIEIIAWKKGSIGIVGHITTSRYNIEDEYYYSRSQIKFSTFGYGIFYKQYFRNRAPLGNYLKAEVDFLHYQYYPNHVLRYGFITASKIEFGKDYLFFNRLKFSVGVSVGLTFSSVDNVLHWLDYHTSHEQAAAARLTGIYWLGVKLGVGFLAF